jgi:hypothetical protein
VSQLFSSRPLKRVARQCARSLRRLKIKVLARVLRSLEIDANDDHPCHNVLDGERLIAEVYNAIRANDELVRPAAALLLQGRFGHRNQPDARCCRFEPPPT